MVGGGVSSDSGIIGHFVWEQKNFDVRDKGGSLMDLFTGKAYRGAGQNLRIAIEPGDEHSSCSIWFTEPYLYERGDILQRKLVFSSQNLFAYIFKSPQSPTIGQ